MTTDTDTLWAVHVQGADEYHAAPSKEAADRLVAELDGYDRDAAVRHGDNAVFCRAQVVPWPFGADAHAAELAEAKEG